ncbi:hypothetical protein GPLA_3868 [Paraglaciecola polaris LMG 21857]|uniref:Uncharacterized protein n=1 Tax=Paraglaciecola polaris LMG 21857 TaxID=1129793 RepID=K7A1C6_9ALTE|nr:hypothetical protein GPLA_3868 [Paraglaciecola polaris LMG 21857]
MPGSQSHGEITTSNAGKIDALQAQQEVLADEASALLQKLVAQLYVLLEEMGHSRNVIDTLQQRI